MAKLNPKQLSKQAWTACKNFLAKRWGWMVGTLIFLPFLVFVCVLVWTGQLETGLGEYTPSNPNTQRAKTLWDWMELCLVPLILAGGAAAFSWWTDKRSREAEERQAADEREAENRRAQAEREAQERRIEEEHKIGLDRSREAALQAYFDRMTDLIEKGLGESKPDAPEPDAKEQPDDSRRSIARVRTLTVLRQLDGERKGLLLQFLYEAKLIGGWPKESQEQRAAIVGLSWAYLRGAYLRGAILNGAYLSFAFLNEANLQFASLYGAYLSGAILRDADLCEANMEDACLYGADLNGGDLRSANLFGAILSKTDLQRADLRWANLGMAELRDADLTGAILYKAYLYKADLSNASLRSANLHRAELREANLTGDLSNADLREADLRGANLSGANLSGANLEEAKLTGANLFGANLEGANLEGAILSEAILIGADLSGAFLEKANLSGAHLERAILSRATVTDEQFAQARSLEGATMRNGKPYAGDPPTQASKSESPADVIHEAETTAEETPDAHTEQYTPGRSGTDAG